MERYEMEAFLALVDAMHFGQAAARLGISTGRMSQTITKLERRIGAKLFDRTSRRVALTKIGAQFHHDLEPGYQQIQSALERAVASARGFDGPLQVGFVGAAGGQFLLEVVRAYRTEHPGAEVDLKEFQINTTISGLREQNSDMVLITRPFSDPHLVIGPTLWAEARYLAVASSNPLALRAAITQEELAEVTLLRMPDNCPSSLAEDRVPARTPSGRPITHGQAINTFLEALASVSADEGALTVGDQVNHFYQRPDVTYLRITDAAPIEWGLIWRKSYETAGVRAFNDMAVEMIRRRKL
ncbi:LysR family transcriptional regulator [Nocardia sp. NPDC051832]|uniref:LysR family transcriptional regulator n=1 Tax=Nocardia sp. NPDC051832 TaxID=3155673 RepID=UPI003425E3B6